MQINVNVSGKQNIVDQLKEDLQALGLQVELPTNLDDITVNQLTVIPSVQDSGDDNTVTPNTTVKVSFASGAGTNETTFNYRRLDFTHLSNALAVSVSGESVFTALEHNGTDVQDNSAALVSGFAALGFSVEDAPTVSVVDTNEDSGVTTYKFSANEQSFLYVGEVDYQVKVRSDDTGFVIENGERRYFTYAAPHGATNVTNVVLPYKGTDIPSNYFQGLAITHLTIPDAVKTIGESAFANSFTSLENVVFGAGVTTISDNAFLGANTTTFTLPESITSLGGDSLGTVGTVVVSSLQQVAIVHENYAAGTEVTYQTPNAEDGALDTTNAVYGVFEFGNARGSIYFKNEDLADEVFANSEFTKEFKSLVLPATVTEVPVNIFQKVNTDVLDLSNVTSVGANAFANATITEIKVTSINA